MAVFDQVVVLLKQHYSNGKQNSSNKFIDGNNDMMIFFQDLKNYGILVNISKSSQRVLKPLFRWHQQCFCPFGKVKQKLKRTLE